MRDGYYVILDPDGTIGDFGLLLLVRANTGIRYAHQCGGLGCESQEAEGFLVPLDPKAQTGLKAFFAQYGGSPPRVWEENELVQLSNILAAIFVFRTSNDSKDERREPLALDYVNISELTEAWVPVVSSFGVGVLLFENSD